MTQPEDSLRQFPGRCDRAVDVVVATARHRRRRRARDGAGIGRLARPDHDGVTHRLERSDSGVGADHDARRRRRPSRPPRRLDRRSRGRLTSTAMAARASRSPRPGEASASPHGCIGGPPGPRRPPCLRGRPRRCCAGGDDRRVERCRRAVGGRRPPGRLRSSGRRWWPARRRHDVRRCGRRLRRLPAGPGGTAEWATSGFAGSAVPPVGAACRRDRAGRDRRVRGDRVRGRRRRALRARRRRRHRRAGVSPARPPGHARAVIGGGPDRPVLVELDGGGRAQTVTALDPDLAPLANGCRVGVGTLLSPFPPAAAMTGLHCVDGAAIGGLGRVLVRGDGPSDGGITLQRDAGDGTLADRRQRTVADLRQVRGDVRRVRRVERARRARCCRSAPRRRPGRPRCRRAGWRAARPGRRHRPIQRRRRRRPTSRR